MINLQFHTTSAVRLGRAAEAGRDSQRHFTGTRTFLSAKHAPASMPFRRNLFTRWKKSPEHGGVAGAEKDPFWMTSWGVAKHTPLKGGIARFALRFSLRALRPALFAAFALLLTAPLAFAQGKMYWAENSGDAIKLANLDGSGVSTLPITTVTAPQFVALDMTFSTIYWTESSTGKLRRANLDGSNFLDLVTGLSDPKGLALDLSVGKIYWTETGSDKISRSDLDGSNVEILVTGLYTPNSIALDLTNAKMYWVDEDAAAIQRANLDGSSVETLVTAGLSEPSGIALHVAGNKMYWGDLGVIKRANLDGSTVETLVTGLDRPRDMDLDVFEGKMYWTDEDAGKIQRANLDGTSVEDLVTGISFPIGLALDVAASPNARFVSFSGPGGFVVSRSKLISQGQIFSNGNLHFQKGDPTIYNGDLFAVGNIIIDKDNTINGNLRAGGTITVNPKATVNGTIKPSDPFKPPDPVVPGDPLCSPTDPFQVINIGKGGSRTLTPGDPCKFPGDPHYDVNVGNSATLNLSSGAYTFFDLETQSESIINFDVSNGAVVLNVLNKFALGKKVTFNISPGGQANSHLVTIFAFQGSKVVVDKGGYVLGNLNVPNAEVSIGKNVSLRGAVGANKVSVDRDVIFLHHSSPSVLPKQVVEDEERGEMGEGRVVSYELEQNYPNPFNPSTVIKFALPEAGEVSLAIYNMNGQLVRTLYSGEMPVGRFEVEWDGKNEAGVQVASGVYVYELQAGEFVAQRKLVVMR